MSYKLIGTKPGESADDAIIRCANNLVEAVLAAGYSLHGTSGCSGLGINFFDHIPGEISVQNVLSHWEIIGKTKLKITFDPHENELVQDDAEENHE